MTTDRPLTATPTIPAAPAFDAHWKAFERFAEPRDRRQPDWLLPMRKASLARFTELGFPTLRQEDWRFTNVAPIARLPFKPVLAPGAAPSRAALDALPFAKLPGTRLVFVDGH